MFSVEVEIAKPGGKGRWKKLGPVIIETGSELTWLPDVELRGLRIELFRKDQVFVMANGQNVTRDVGIALIRCGEFKTVDEVRGEFPWCPLDEGERDLAAEAGSPASINSGSSGERIESRCG